MRALLTRTAYLLVQSYAKNPETGDVFPGNKHVKMIPAGVDLYQWLKLYGQQHPYLGLNEKAIRSLDNKREFDQFLGTELLFEYRILENEIYSTYDKDVPKEKRPEKRKVNFDIT